MLSADASMMGMRLDMSNVLKVGVGIGERIGRHERRIETVSVLRG